MWPKTHTVVSLLVVIFIHIVTSHGQENVVSDHSRRLKREGSDHSVIDGDTFEPEHHHFTNNVKLGNLDQVNQDFGLGGDLGPVPPKLTGPNVCTKQEP